MPVIDQHVLKFRSPVDGREIPVHVSAPQQLPKSRLPIVFLLHDSDADPSPGEFIEEAFRQAAAWKSAMADGPAGLLVQVWGRGNAAWLGPAGRTLFDVWEELQDHFVLSPTAAVLGTGAGGSGAIQLTASFPKRFHSAAAINPWTDERLFLPLGTSDHPVWESVARAEVRPIELAAKLSGKKIAMAQALIGDAFGALVAKRHFASMAEAFNRAGIDWRDFSVTANSLSDQPPTVDLAGIWCSLLSSEDGERSKIEWPKRLFWRPITIVVGTLGESPDNDAMRGFAERLRERWLSGEDSSHPHFGVRQLVQEIAISTDAEAVAGIPDGDLLILGSPRLNLLSAKWADRLAASWPSSESDEFAILGRTFANPSAFVVARKDRPDERDGEAWIVAAGSTEAWVDVDRLNFAFLPKIFVQPKGGEVLWMDEP